MLRRGVDRGAGTDVAVLGRGVAGGLLAWAVLPVYAPLVGGQLTLVDGMLALAMLVVVPLAAPLVGRAPRGLLLAAVAAAAALPLASGLVAGLLTAPWLVLSVAWGVQALSRWWRAGHALDDGLTALAAVGYLGVGAAWALADGAGLEPAGFRAPFVQLTAIHFHYAGFVSAALGACLVDRLGTRTANVAAWLIVAAPPLIAIGFVAVGPLQVAGAVVLTAGLVTMSWLVLRHVVPSVGGAAAALLALSAAAVVVPMLLAVQWALGANLGTPALSIPAMARVHGVTNALGFALAGVVGWRLAGRAAAGQPR